MAEKKTLETIFKIIWIPIMVLLWIAFPFLPGDIFFWMWLAIIWSIIGGVIGTLFFMVESKTNVKIISIIWAVILVLLWVFYPYFPGYIMTWLWTAIIWSLIGLILALSLFIVKRVKQRKTQI